MEPEIENIQKILKLQNVVLSQWKSPGDFGLTKLKIEKART